MADRRCEWCGEVYGEQDCRTCGRGLCETCDPTTRRNVLTGTCWDCENRERGGEEPQAPFTGGLGGQ